MRDFPAGNYDSWKLRTPEDEMPQDPRDDETCPHGEDRPDDCEDCNFDPPDDDAQHGCVLGADCLHHDPFHTAAECFDVEMAKHFMGDETP